MESFVFAVTKSWVSMRYYSCSMYALYEVDGSLTATCGLLEKILRCVQFVFSDNFTLKLIPSRMAIIIWSQTHHGISKVSNAARQLTSYIGLNSVVASNVAA